MEKEFYIHFASFSQSQNWPRVSQKSKNIQISAYIKKESSPVWKLHIATITFY